MRSLIRDAWFIIQNLTSVNPFFLNFLFFSYYYRKYALQNPNQPPRIAEKSAYHALFLKPLRGYDGFNSLLYHLGNLCCLHSLVFLVWDRVEKMDFYRYGTDGIGVKRNKTVF